ncbi:UNKNOWN [Stylonychia lemnae]|uniref:Coiled-coil domain-containing protein 86 n=1 Tax=Stylonychia lemnae TaxID=5949 RepID=A0A078AF01_STYLE|nr:UNKNOWN [Stylonychia lemnae]|eukprot:CDW80800.1 UNKNOWN [Stylonychia lemnae]
MVKKNKSPKIKQEQQTQKQEQKKPAAVVAEQAPVKAATVEVAYIPQPYSLSKLGPKTIGKAKSGKSWNVASKRAPRHSVYNPKTWEEKTEQRKKLKALKDRVAEAKLKKKQEKQSRAVQLREKLKRKELNQMKSATYQLIKDTTKIRKWSKKAKTQLSKLPAEIFYQKFGK